MFFEMLLLAVCAYFANATPVLLGGGNSYLDFGVKIGGKPVLGKNKTIRGLLSGISAGIIVAFLAKSLSANPDFFYAGVLAGIGAMLGDLVGSFAKRRLLMKEGKPYFFDGFLFIIFAYLLAYPFAFQFYDAVSFAGLCVLSYALHVFFNWFAYKMKWKSVPW